MGKQGKGLTFEPRFSGTEASVALLALQCQESALFQEASPEDDCALYKTEGHDPGEMMLPFCFLEYSEHLPSLSCPFWVGASLSGSPDHFLPSHLLSHVA